MSGKSADWIDRSADNSAINLFLPAVLLVSGVILVYGAIPVSGVLSLSVFLPESNAAVHVLLFKRAAYLAKISKFILERSSSKDFCFFKRL